MRLPFPGKELKAGRAGMTMHPGAHHFDDESYDNVSHRVMQTESAVEMVKGKLWFTLSNFVDDRGLAAPHYFTQHSISLFEIIYFQWYAF